MADPKTQVVILAGGSGTRFWPLSKPQTPKQVLNLFDGKSLLNQTFLRMKEWPEPNDISLCTLKTQKKTLEKEVPSLKNWILEPASKNTFHGILLCVSHFLHKSFSPDTVMVVVPSDHYIQNTKTFYSVLDQAVDTARSTGGLVLLGIKPTRPHTGYGYIEAQFGNQSKSLECKKFIEKPNLETAEKLLKHSHMYWNSGIFIWTLGAFQQAVEKLYPERWTRFLETPEKNLAEFYKTLPSEPVDKAILEKWNNTWVIPVEMGWSDVGNWSTLHELSPKDSSANSIIQGEPVLESSSGCLVHVPKGKKVALIGVKDLIVVDTGDELLIVPKDQDQKISLVHPKLT